MPISAFPISLPLLATPALWISALKPVNKKYAQMTPAPKTARATTPHLQGDPYAPHAHFALPHPLVHAAEQAGIPVRVGPVASVDVFYNTDADYFRKWRERGVLAFEMEASVLFYLAARAGIQAARLLTVSDVLNEQEGHEETSM